MSYKESSGRQKIQQVIYDCIEKAIEILLLRYGKNCAPKGKHGRHPNEVMDHIRMATRLLQRNLHTSLIIDIFREGSTSSASPLLLERWNLHFQHRKDDTKDIRLSYISKHTGILIRTLYCYVRLLSSYNLSERCQDCKIAFLIYSHDDTSVEKAKFVSDYSSYGFPKIRTPYGGLSLSLKYLPSAVIKVVHCHLTCLIYSQDLINPVVDSIPIDTKNDMVIDAVMPTPNEDHFDATRRHSLGTATPAPIPIPSSSWATASTPHIGTAPSPSAMESLDPPTNARQTSRSLDSRGSSMPDSNKGSTANKSSSATGPYGHITRSGKPPPHPDLSSNSYNNSPFSITSAAPAFYIANSPADSDSFVEELAIGASPPYYAPPTQLQSTSPQIGSNIMQLREQYAGVRVPSQKFQGSRPTSQDSAAGSASLGIDLGEIPLSPFDEEVSAGAGGATATDSSKADPSESSGFYPMEATDQDIFDDISDDEEMPFAWSQAPADEFVFKKSASKSGEVNGNSSGYHSFIAQQCVAPPVLSSFQNDRFSQSLKASDAFSQLQQFKDFHVAISQRLV